MRNEDGNTMNPTGPYAGKTGVFFCIAAFSILFCSCSDKGPANTGEIAYELSGPMELSAPADGITQEYTIKTAASWEIVRKSVETWGEVISPKGTNDGTFQIRISGNKYTKKRTMKFAILLNGTEQSGNIVATQDGAPLASWDETGQDEQLLIIQPGVPAHDGTAVSYRRAGTPFLEVELPEPTIVAVAQEEMPWGYFQFPVIARNVLDNSLVCTWSMVEDNTGGYGKGESGRRISFDKGKTWGTSDAPVRAGVLLFPNGVAITVKTPEAWKVSELAMPDPIKTVENDGSNYNRKFTFYRHDELPADLQGVYIDRWSNAGTYSLMHAKLNDQHVVRFDDDGLFPIIWWGDMRLLDDGSVVTGIYPAIYEQNDGTIEPSGVAFYKSGDQGASWNIVGTIPYGFDPTWDVNGGRRQAYGFTEPAFEILADGTYLCVARTTDGYGDSPMYISRSVDRGATWSAPVAFTPSGVLPKLLQLENGVLVLASGRPGLQLRFSTDGKGEHWTDPFELVRYEKNESSTAATCGYPRLLATGPDRFLVVYSDFKYPAASGTLRKAIKVREVTVIPK